MNKGYHVSEIPRGTYGEVSKIEEELEELKDSIRQKNRIMELLELSDMIGAIEGYLNNYHCGYGINDLIAMAEITKKVFKDGTRKSNDRLL